MQITLLITSLLTIQSNGFVSNLWHRRIFRANTHPKMRSLPPQLRNEVNDKISDQCENQEHSDTKLSKEWFGFALLNLVAILWGSQHVVIKSSIDANLYTSASLMNFWRFLSSAILFSPALYKTKDAETIKAGSELGLYTFLGFAFQSIGLATTTASRSAFLLYLNVKIVPFLAAVIYKRTISPVTWTSAFLALAGTALLSTDGGWPNTGDLWCIGAAVASALYILRLEAHAKLNNVAGINAVAFLTVTVLCGMWVGGDLLTSQVPNSEEQLILSVWRNPLPVLYLGVITTGLCNYLQTLGQRSIPAERAAIIYSIDPVYAAGFAYVFLGESLGSRGVCGAFLIMTGILVSTLYAKSDT